MSDRPNDLPGAAPGNIASLSALADRLRSFGYDIEPPRTGDPPDRDIIARRHFGDRAILFTADSGGRFRVEITWLVGEWPSRQEIAGVPVRVVDRVNRAVDLVGQVDDPAHLPAVAAGLGTIVSWATEPRSDGKPASDDQPATGELPPPP